MEPTTTTNKLLTSVCRCCLGDGCFKDISTEYFWMGKREVYAEMLLDAFNVTILCSKQEDMSNTSHLICEQCITRLRDAAAFKQQVIQCEKMYKDRLVTEISENPLTSDPLEDMKKETDGNADDTKKVFEVAPDENDDDYDDADNQPLTNFSSSPKNDIRIVKTETLSKLTEKRPIKTVLTPPPIKRIKIPEMKIERVSSLSTLKRIMAKAPPPIKGQIRTMLDKKALNQQIISKLKKIGVMKSESNKSVSRQVPRSMVRQPNVSSKGPVKTLNVGGKIVVRKQIKPSTSDSKLAVPPRKALKREDRKDIASENAVIILKNSTAYPFQPSGFSFRCCFCRKNFDDPNHFRMHMDTDHDTVDRSTAVKHRNDSLTRVDITNLKCKVCNDVFASLEIIANHFNEAHKLNIDTDHNLGVIPFRLDQERMACVICGKIFSNMKQLSRHCGTHFSRNICDTCGQNFETLRGLGYHVRFSHSKYQFLCRTCGMHFSTLEEKKEHAVTSKRCHGFSCNMCGERFRNANLRQEHLEKVHGKPKVTYNCSVCGAVFQKSMTRYLHFKANHTDDNKCEYCGMRFSTKRHLQEHVSREHTGERPHKCSVCDKSFIAIKGLRTHEAIHDDSKKVVCPVCGRLFAVRTRLKHHMRKHHREAYAKEFPENE